MTLSSERMYFFINLGDKHASLTCRKSLTGQGGSSSRLSVPAHGFLPSAPNAHATGPALHPNNRYHDNAALRPLPLGDPRPIHPPAAPAASVPRCTASRCQPARSGQRRGRTAAADKKARPAWKRERRGAPGATASPRPLPAPGGGGRWRRSGAGAGLTSLPGAGTLGTAAPLPAHAERPCVTSSAAAIVTAAHALCGAGR